jgi:predicted secreted hydrolase
LAKHVIAQVGPDAPAAEGLTTRPTIWEDGQRAATDPGYFEWWYFDANLEDGSIAVVIFATKPLLQRTDPLTPLVEVNITLPDGRKIRGLAEHQPDEFSAAQDRCAVQSGPSWVRGDLHRYELHAEAQGVMADLVLTGLVPPWRPGAGKWYADPARAHSFAWVVPVPYGKVEGSLTYEGQTHQVRGKAYHDHNWGNLALNDMISHWFWGRADLGDYHLIFAEMTAAKAYAGQKLPVLMLARGNEIVIDDGRPLVLSTAEPYRHSSGKVYPRLITLHWQGAQGAVAVTLRNTRVIEATSLLLQLPPWKRVLARLLVNPYYFRFHGEMELTVDLNGVHAVERGPVIYELMILH